MATQEHDKHVYPERSTEGLAPQFLINGDLGLRQNAAGKTPPEDPAASPLEAPMP